MEYKKQLFKTVVFCYKEILSIPEISLFEIYLFKLIKWIVTDRAGNT